MAEIKFTSKEHENFYKEMIQKSGNSDSYHRAFFYCIGISDTGRRNVKRVFDFEQDRIIPERASRGMADRGNGAAYKACVQSLERICGTGGGKYVVAL